MLEQRSLITQTVFPAEMIPISVFLSTLLSHLLGLALMVGAVAVILNQISIFLVLLPLYTLALGLLSVGLGWIVASLHVFLRDTAQVVSVITDVLVLGHPHPDQRAAVPRLGALCAARQSALLRRSRLP